MKFIKSLTMTVLLSFLLINVLDPVLRQRMLEGENLFVSFKLRIEDYFSYPNSEDITIPEVVTPEKEEDNNQPISKDEEPSPEEDEKPVDTPPDDNPGEDTSPGGDSSVVIKPFPNIGKDPEPPVDEPVEPNPPVEEPKPQEPEIIEKNPNFTPVYYNQSKSEIGYSQGCLLTSYAMVITNAGRYTGNSKEYDPVDLYLANNPDVTAANQRRVLAYHYVIANGFNYTWNSYSLSSKSDSYKINKVTELLANNPWGVIIGGSYGDNGTHFIVVRLSNGKLVFDDPVKSIGPNKKSISEVWGINSWSKITSVMTITPNLDSKGKWADGLYETKKKNPNDYHKCQTQMYC